MMTQLTLDKAGGVVLPRSMRDELQLGPGDILEIESSEGQIVLRPARGSMPLRKKHGIWVIQTGAPLIDSIAAATLREVREDRDRQNVGKPR